MIQIIEAHDGERLWEARALFGEYAASIGISLDFQGFDRELATLPGSYAPPEGVLLIALWQGRTAGCVALRTLGQGMCEMKRLYTKPEFQGKKIGRALAHEVIRKARRLGYSRMRLDTLQSMERAMALYAALGFREIGPYCHNPVEDAAFMELILE